MAKLIARRYANALFELAQESNRIDRFDEEVKMVYGSINDNDEFRTVLNHPQLSAEEKMAMLENVFKDSVCEDILGLFHLVLRKNREAELIEILSVFIDKVREFKRITTAYVFSAKPLSENQLKEIEVKLSQNLNKQVNIEASVEPELIGGVRILVDGHVIDGTIKKQISELKKRLADIQLV